MLLVAEMSVFMLLIVPLPFTWKRKLFNFISENPLIAKLQYGMKVCGPTGVELNNLADRWADHVYFHLDLVH